MNAHEISAAKSDRLDFVSDSLWVFVVNDEIYYEMLNAECIIMPISLFYIESFN